MRRKYSAYYLILLIAVICIGVSACSRRPSVVLPPDKMARVIADLHIAESVVEQERRSYSNDSLKKALKQSVLMRNKVTTEQLDTSLSWYGYNLEKYIEVYDKVIVLLEEDITRAQNAAGSKNEATSSQRFLVEGDSVDVWPDIRSRRFASTMPTDLIAFALTVDQNWEKGDIYELSARMTGASGPVELTLVSEYHDGIKDYNTTRKTGDGWHKVTLALDPERTASSIYGTLRYIAPTGEVALMDSISLVRSRKSQKSNSLRNRQQSLSNKYGR